MLVSRMLRDKGIIESVEASRLLQARGISFRMVLIGEPDLANRDTLHESELMEWQREGLVEWWGRRDDIAKCYAQAEIACLPSSYGEGVPKSLLEAASCGLPIVTTDAPGCREVVRQQENGLLVQVRNPVALADALEILLRDPEIRTRMGQCSRKLAEKEFAVEHIVTQTLALYDELLV